MRKLFLLGLFTVFLASCFPLDVPLPLPSEQIKKQKAPGQIKKLTAPGQASKTVY